MTQEERYKYMTEGKVSHIIPRLAIPSIVSMLTTSIYNMADTYFVSKISTEASAAVGVNFSIMAMIQAVGFMLGMGCGNYISRLLGRKQNDEAASAASTVFITSLAIGTIFTIISLLFLEPFVSKLGAIPSVLPYAMDYAKYILIAAPVMMGSFLLNNLLRSQGYATRSMIGICTGGLLNIAFDPLFIFVFDMGIKGAAIATGLSQLISFTILLLMVTFTKSSIHINLKLIKPSIKLYCEVIHSGLPSLCRQGLSSVSSIVLNNVAGPYGASAIAAVSIVNRFMMMIYSSVIGFGQGFQPVCGFNYGAKKYNRVLEAYSFCIKLSISILTVLGVIAFIFAPQIISLIKNNDQQVIEIGAKALRFQCLTLPIQGVLISSQFMIQSIGYGIRASLIAMGRQGLFLIPAYIILEKIWKLNGILASQPVSDIFTLIATLIITYTVITKLKNLIKSEEFSI